jgi:hypothetical protein
MTHLLNRLGACGFFLSLAGSFLLDLLDGFASSRRSMLDVSRGSEDNSMFSGGSAGKRTTT